MAIGKYLSLEIYPQEKACCNVLPMRMIFPKMLIENEGLKPHFF